MQRQAEVSGVESFFFEPLSPLAWQAGQFLHYVLHHRPTDDRGSDRWFTISSAPSEKIVRITTRFDGERHSTFKKTLFELKIGDAIEASELEGDFTLGDPAGAHIFVSGGIGITPFRSILKELDLQGARPVIGLLYSNRNEHFVFRDELEQFAKRNPNLKIQYVVAPERIDVVKIQEFASRVGAEKPTFYISGPEPMVENLGSALKSEGTPAEDIKQDWFPGYPEE